MQVHESMPETKPLKPSTLDAKTHPKTHATMGVQAASAAYNEAARSAADAFVDLAEALDVCAGSSAVVPWIPKRTTDCLVGLVAMEDDEAAIELATPTLSREMSTMFKIAREALVSKVERIEEAFESGQDQGYTSMTSLCAEYDFGTLWKFFVAKHPDWASKFGSHCECENTQAASIFTALMAQAAFQLTIQELYAILASHVGARVVNHGAAQALLIGSSPKVSAFRTLLHKHAPLLDEIVRGTLQRAHLHGDFDLDCDADAAWLRIKVDSEDADDAEDSEDSEDSEDADDADEEDDKKEVEEEDLVDVVVEGDKKRQESEATVGWVRKRKRAADT
jgi:hypothetical protein